MKVNTSDATPYQPRRVAITEIVRRLSAEAKQRISAVKAPTFTKAQPSDEANKLFESYRHHINIAQRADRRLRTLGWYMSGSVLSPTGDNANGPRQRWEAEITKRCQRVDTLCTSALIELSVMDRAAVVPYLTEFQKTLEKA